VIVYFEQLNENYRNTPHFWDTYFHFKGYALILAKIGRATFCPMFFKTHPVTNISKALIFPVGRLKNRSKIAFISRINPKTS
jgi:hypothetical protein